MEKVLWFITLLMEKKSNLSLSTSQRTVLAQSLRFSLNILEMNNIELQDFINNSLNENPFLKENDEIENHLYFETIDNIVAPMHDKDNFFKEIAFLKFNETEKNIAELLYDYVLENKYITSEFCKNISKEKSISYQNILDIIKKLQDISMQGLFSFNLKDKIKNIFETKGKYDTEHKIFIQNIDILLLQGLSAFQKRTNLSKLTLRKIISDIKNIGYFVETEQNHHCIFKSADIIIKKTNSNYNSEINNLQSPLIDWDLYNQTSKKIKSKQDNEYIKEKITEAELLVRSINYRNSTLLKIIQEIAHRQNDFFIGRSSFLIPISAQSIANSIMCHQSTIHRAISNKTVSTPCGIFDIKELMPKEIKSEKSETIVTDHSVKQYIQTLINNEPKNSPYSDNDIVCFLEGRGINMSRRTIAKYRNDMDIANSNNRLKEYSLMEM